MAMLNLLEEEDLSEQPDIYSVKAKFFFQELVDEAFPSVTLCGREYKRGNLTRILDEEYFEVQFVNFLEECKEKKLIVTTRSTNPKRKVVWSTRISEFVLIKRALEIVSEMEI